MDPRIPPILRDQIKELRESEEPILRSQATIMEGVVVSGIDIQEVRADIKEVKEKQGALEARVTVVEAFMVAVQSAQRDRSAVARFFGNMGAHITGSAVTLLTLALMFLGTDLGSAWVSALRDPELSAVVRQDVVSSRQPAVREETDVQVVVESENDAPPPPRQ